MPEDSNIGVRAVITGERTGLRCQAREDRGGWATPVRLDRPVCFKADTAAGRSMQTPFLGLARHTLKDSGPRYPADSGNPALRNRPLQDVLRAHHRGAMGQVCPGALVGAGAFHHLDQLLGTHPPGKGIFHLSGGEAEVSVRRTGWLIQGQIKPDPVEKPAGDPAHARLG